MPYQNDREFGDQFLPEVCKIIGPRLLEPSSFEVDTKEATDLIILHARDKRIGVRVRRHNYLAKYGNQITFRLARDSGAITEWEKILRGWGDWFFYGFAGPEDSPPLSRWFLIELDALRYSFTFEKPFLKQGVQDNHDGTHFRWFDVRSLSNDPLTILASSHQIEKQAA